MLILYLSCNKGEIVKIVLMLGDFLRVEYMVKKFLINFKLVFFVRNIYFYIGEYKGKLVIIGVSGMGVVSMGIYVYELFIEYDVDVIIRLGLIGLYVDWLDIK